MGEEVEGPLLGHCIINFSVVAMCVYAAVKSMLTTPLFWNVWNLQDCCLFVVLSALHNILWENFGVMTYRNEINPENPHYWAFPHLVEASLHGG